MARKKQNPAAFMFEEDQTKPVNLKSVKFEPKGRNQAYAAAQWNKGKNLLMTGYPGTGKTFVALALAVKELERPGADLDQILIVRSTVAVRDQGFLKGDVKEKAAIYEEPYFGPVNKIFGREDAYSIATKTGKIKFVTTSYLRGLNKKAVIIMDEVQNYSEQETHTVITRAEEGSRVIVLGDTGQDDLTSARYNTTSGFSKFIKILHAMQSFEYVNYTADDICRGALVKEYILAKERIEMEEEYEKQEKKQPKKQLLREVPDEENIVEEDDYEFARFRRQLHG